MRKVKCVSLILQKSEMGMTVEVTSFQDAFAYFDKVNYSR